MAGNKPKPIDTDKVALLARLGCTVEEIAAEIGCCDRTLRRRCLKLMQEARHQACISLRRAQFVQALKGNTTMLIWLGKQMLHQSDRPDAPPEAGLAGRVYADAAAMDLTVPPPGGFVTQPTPLSSGNGNGEALPPE